jgi:hypothetical protein
MARGSVVARFFLLFSSSHSRQSPAAVGRILLGYVSSARACALERSLSNTFSLRGFFNLGLCGRTVGEDRE